MTDDWKRSNYNTALDAMRRNEGAFDPAEKAQDYIARKRYRAHPDRHGASGWFVLLLIVMMSALIIGLVVSVVRGL